MGTIKIIGGNLRGQRIQVPKGGHVRPTSNKVREAIFNVLQSRVRWQETLAIDLFAGSGALGFEALSRGAKSCFLIEKNRKTWESLQTSIKQLRVSDNQVQLIYGSAQMFLKSEQKFMHPCVLFVDPPYFQEQYTSILGEIEECAFIQQQSIIMVESDKAIEVSIPRSWELFQERVYGRIQLRYYYK